MPACWKFYEEDMQPELKELVEDVLLNRRPDATERLVTYGEKLGQAASAGTTATDKKAEEEWRKGTVEERLAHALVKGLDTYIDADILLFPATIDKPASPHPIWRPKTAKASTPPADSPRRSAPLQPARLRLEAFCCAGLRGAPSSHCKRAPLPPPAFIVKSNAPDFP